MSTPWIVAFAALTAVVITLAILVAGFGAKVLEALEEVNHVHAPDALGANPTLRGVTLGTRGPIEAFSHAGNPLPQGESIVIFLESSCGECRALVKALAKRPAEVGGLPVVVVLDAVEEFKTLESFGWQLIVDEHRTIFRAWLVTGTPLAYLINSDGVVRGVDIPNAPEHVSALAALRTQSRTGI